MLAQVGGTRYSNTGLGETAASVVAGPVLLFNIFAFNGGAAATYLQFFDALEADVTVGSTTSTLVIGLPIGGGVNITATLPEGFRTGIVVACTATATGSGAPSADAVIELGYVGG